MSEARTPLTQAFGSDILSKLNTRLYLYRLRTPCVCIQSSIGILMSINYLEVHEWFLKPKLTDNKVNENYAEIFHQWNAIRLKEYSKNSKELAELVENSFKMNRQNSF